MGRLKILFVTNTTIPNSRYGGISRLVYNLAKALYKLNNDIIFLSPPGSYSDFGVMYHSDKYRINDNVFDSVDIIHFNESPKMDIKKPHIVTLHTLNDNGNKLSTNSVFISRKHASLYNSNVFVHPGLDWDSYPTPDLNKPREGLLFLGNDTIISKNLDGAISVANRAKTILNVIGNSISYAYSIPSKNNIKLYGYLEDDQKVSILDNTKALIFPITKHETFGLAVIEAMYYGNYILGTPYGALPEIIDQYTGFLNIDASILADKFNSLNVNRKICNDRAIDLFSASVSAKKYLILYQRILDGEKLHTCHPVLGYKQDTLPWKQ